jgi:hypothetical protein
MRDIEIQQIPKLETTKPQIAQQLRPMYRKYRFECLQLDDNEVPDEQIDSVPNRWLKPRSETASPLAYAPADFAFPIRTGGKSRMRSPATLVRRSNAP